MSGRRTNPIAILQARIDGVTLSAYAESLAARERYLDEGGIAQGWFGGLKGEVEWVESMLEVLADRFRVPFVRGDLERSNRIAEWDRRIRESDTFRAVWCEVYAIALVRMRQVDPYSPRGSAEVARVKVDRDLMMNPFLSIAKREPGISTESCRSHRRIVADAFESTSRIPNRLPAAGRSPFDEDVIVFPGERLSRLSDFARLEKEAREGDVYAMLARDGIDREYYDEMMARWYALARMDPMLAARFADLLEAC